MKLILCLLMAFGLSAHASFNNQGCGGCSLSGTAIVLASSEKTAAINLKGLTLVGIMLPATFTGTSITFEASDAVDGTFVVVKAGTGGSSLSYTVAQNTWVALDPKDFYGLNFIKIVSGGNETADRTIVLSLKGL